MVDCERRESNNVEIVHNNKYDAETKTIITTEEIALGSGIKESHYQRF